MSVMVQWDDTAETIVRMEFRGKWTWDEMYAATEKSIALRKTKAYKCALLMDMIGGSDVPNGALTHMRTAFSRSSDDREVTVVITDKQFVRTLASMFTKLYKRLGDRLLVVETLDEARRAIAEWRSASEE